ncbi:MAG: Clp protease ClpP [Sphingobium sp.]|nr:Clp protease ClpP [Sphingobium sp.]
MTDILIYGIVGDWWDNLEAKSLVPLISEGDDDLNIRINSPGGYVMEGLAIFNAIQREAAKGRKVTTYIDGLAASMGSVLAMAGSEIIMADNALMMIHNPWDCACGDADELRRAADKLDMIRDQLVNIYAKQTGMDNGALVAMLDAETWLTPAEALAQNFITSISGGETIVAMDVSKFGFKKAPEGPHFAAAAMVRGARAATAATHNQRKEEPMPAPANPAVVEPSATNQQPVAVTAADVNNAVVNERKRVSDIQTLAKQHGITDDVRDELISSGADMDAARAKILDTLAAAGDGAQIGHNSPARVTHDQRDKFREGATNWLLVKAGVAGLVEKAAALQGKTVKIDPGEFRGVRNADLARESLQMAGINCTARDPDMVVRDAMTARSQIGQTTSDFPILFEEALHRVLQAAYLTTPDTWQRFCGIGSVSDFRAHNRYLRGSFGKLDRVNEAGEFKNKAIPDLAKETIKADTVGNIVSLTRQAIVNDDMDVFSGIAVDLGRAAKLSIEIDVYALLAANPIMNDGKPFFHADHGNLAGTGAVPSMAAFEAVRVAMASQKDISGNEFIENRPYAGLFPLALEGLANTVNGSEYDPDAINKLQKPNIVKGMLSEVIGSPRRSGTSYDFFADPAIAPAFEVVFLNGVSEPWAESREGWRVDGTEWKIRHDYGVGGVNYRSAYRQPGA